LCAPSPDAELTLTQSGATVSGTYANGPLVCGVPGDPTTTEAISGTVSGSSVNLFVNDLGQNTGSVSGNAMSGQLTVMIDISTGIITLTGPWSATRIGA